jgi:hypothetical protein
VAQPNSQDARYARKTLQVSNLVMKELQKIKRAAERELDQQETAGKNPLKSKSIPSVLLP